MKITAIKQQVKRSDRYSIFVEGKYAFSLGEGALLETKLASGQELNEKQIEEYKKLSAEDKLYNQALRYVAMRPRSRWEIETYLKRKDSPAPLIEQITNKLAGLGLVDDVKLARAYVHDRQLLRPTSRRKIISELKKKRLPGEAIEAALAEYDAENEAGELATLQTVIATKRRQGKYQDDDKLMQYLARQGFNYGDIKSALQAADTD